MARSAEGFVGLIFRRPLFVKVPVSQSRIAQALAEFVNDSDMLGTTLAGYAKSVVSISAGRFRNHPAVVLTSSDLEEDIIKAKSLGARDYRVKPASLNILVDLLRELHASWLGKSPNPSNLS